MNEREMTRLSRFLSLILRHKPEEIGIALDANGWADVDDLLNGVNRSGRQIDRTVLESIVASDEKGRYAFSDDGKRIRACQGHSVDIDLQLTPLEPPEFLYHGTASRFSKQIATEGLKPRSRQYVHLSLDRETATNVGSRHGKPIVYRIPAQEMSRAGFLFYRSENNIWLTAHVPAKYLRYDDE